MSVSQDDADQALWMLRATAEQYGQAIGHREYCDADLKRVKALEFLECGKGSVAERESRAYASENYLEAMRALQNAVAEAETLKAQRQAADWTLRKWQTEESSARQGVV